MFDWDEKKPIHVFGRTANDNSEGVNLGGLSKLSRLDTIDLARNDNNDQRVSFRTPTEDLN